MPGPARLAPKQSLLVEYTHSWEDGSLLSYFSAQLAEMREDVINCIGTRTPYDREDRTT